MAPRGTALAGGVPVSQKRCDVVEMKRQLWVAVATLVLVACGGGDTVEVRGKVTDQEGTQPQNRVGAFAGEGLGGSGTVATASKVRVSTVGQGGQLSLVGEAEVAVQGSYSLEVPAEQQRLVIQAVDSSGTVVASALLDATGESGNIQMAPPMDSETSLEAEIFLQMVADGAQVAQTNTVDLRARVNAKMAAAARQGASTREAVQTRVKALAEAVRAAQETEIQAYAKAGVNTSQSALFQAELAASVKLNEALAAGNNAEQTYDTFYRDLAAAAETVGAKAKEQARAESSASVAFRATVGARLSAQDARPLADASIRAAAAVEARTSSAALSAILQAAAAADAATVEANRAATSLRTSVSAATTASAAAQAYASFSASVATSANVQSTVLGSYLGVSVVNQVAVSTAVQATATASAALDTALNIAVEGAVTSSQTNVTQLATGVANAYATYANTVEAQATTLAVFGTKTAPAVDVLLIAEGSFRMR
jgi:hypothetical protein